MKKIEISFVERAGAKAKDPEAVVAFGGYYGGRKWSMKPEAVAMAIAEGLYGFYVVVFDEVLPVVLVRNERGGVCGIGTPKDKGPLQLLMTLPVSGSVAGSGPEETVTVTKTRNTGSGARKQVVKKTVK